MTRRDRGNVSMGIRVSIVIFHFAKIVEMIIAALEIWVARTFNPMFFQPCPGWKVLRATWIIADVVTRGIRFMSVKTRSWPRSKRVVASFAVGHDLRAEVIQVLGSTGIHPLMIDVQWGYSAYRDEHASGNLLTLTRSKFIRRVNTILRAANKGYPRITGHCFRIGGTTFYLISGVPPDMVKKFLEYWRCLDSDYLGAIHIEMVPLDPHNQHRFFRKPA